MKKKTVSFVLLIIMLFSATTVALATVKNSRVEISSWHDDYVKVATATIIDRSLDGGYLPVSLAGSIDAAYILTDGYNRIYCTVANLPFMGNFLPGCTELDIGGKILTLLDEGMKMRYILKEPGTENIIGDPNGYVKKTGDVIYLGSDHEAYEIWAKPEEYDGLFMFLGFPESENVVLE